MSKAATAARQAMINKMRERSARQDRQEVKITNSREAQKAHRARLKGQPYEPPTRRETRQDASDHRAFYESRLRQRGFTEPMIRLLTSGTHG
jgi:hypothetical protein